MTPERIRELVSRREDSDLDFKSSTYDWDSDGNNELAKDLMAIANKLGPHAAPGYILIGVEETEVEKTGRIVGVQPELHLDDANMHEKVKYLLNRMPNFSYSAVTVDGLSVGVFEIRAGGRPIFPLKKVGARHKLERFQPLCRAGTATDVASPDQVVAWAYEDNPIDNELRSLELEERENKLANHARILAPGTTNAGDTATFDFSVVNDGEAPFRITSAAMHWRVDSARLSAWLIANGGRLIRSPSEDVVVVARFERDTLRAANTSKISTTITGSDLGNRLAALVETEGAHPAPPYATFALGHLEADLEGNTRSRRRTLSSAQFPLRA